MEKIEWKTLDPAAKKAWRLKGIIVFGLTWFLFALSTILGWYYTPPSNPDRGIALWIFIAGTISILIIFIIYNIWITMYYPRYSYALGKEGLLINRGIWWKYKRTIPYARIQHISIDQGPIEQIYGIYRINSYTAGTGSLGGASAGSNFSGPEGQILGVRQPDPLRVEILKYVMESHFSDGITDISSGGTMKDVLEELRAIRKTLEKK